MKKVIIPILAMLLITACGNKTTNSVAESDSIKVDSIAKTPEVTDDNKDADAAKAVVEAAYKSYFNPSEEEQKEQEEAEINIFNLSYMYKYVTEELNEKIVMAYDKQNATEDLFLDYDIWINAQDWDSPSLKEVNIIDSSTDKATAEVTFMNFKKEQKAYVVVEKNKKDGKWLICDFLSPSDKSSFVKDLDDFLAKPYEE